MGFRLRSLGVQYDTHLNPYIWRECRRLASILEVQLDAGQFVGRFGFDKFSQRPILATKADIRALAGRKFVARFFQRSSGQTALPPSGEQKTKSYPKTNLFNCEISHPPAQSLKHVLLLVLGWCSLICAGSLALLGLIMIGGSSGNASVTLSGMVLMTIAFFLAQWSLALIDVFF